MRLLHAFLIETRSGKDRRLLRILTGSGLLFGLLVAGCTSQASRTEAVATGAPPSRHKTVDIDPAPRSGVPLPQALQFVLAHENVRSAPYYPFEGLAGVTYQNDGTLYVCDEQGGRVHAWSAARNRWFQFNSPGSRYFRPVDIQVDGFHALVLDQDDRELLRYDLGGVFLDRFLDFTYLQPGYDRVPTAFDVDLDGSLVVTDGGEHQVLILDGYLSVRETIGGPGHHRERFDNPAGVVFTRNGGIVVSDRDNRRLQRFARNGAYDGEVGGLDDPSNPLLTPGGLDRDEFGNIFVADAAAGAVHVYSSELKHLFSLGNDIQLSDMPEAPVDVAVGPDGLLAVSDRSRQAVLIYRILYR